MVFSQIYKFLAASLLVTSSIFFFLWKSAQYDNQVLRVNQQTLEQSIQFQRETITHFKKNLEDQNKNIAILISSNENSQAKLNDQLSEINSLRSLENKRAIENPFQRGNVATTMFNKRLSALTGETNRDTN